MSEECRALIVERIRQHGPLTFAEFMDAALYDPAVGYYARSTRRSGKSGDFYTSVDVGPVFGELLAVQFAEMLRLISDAGEQLDGASNPAEAESDTSRGSHATRPVVDLVEAGAGNGRLARDVLTALEREAPDVYGALRLTLAERSATARAAQRDTLGRHASKLASSSDALPPSIRGVLFANELLDALPPHVVIGTSDGPREIFVDQANGDLFERTGALSSPALQEHMLHLGVRLEPGWRAEVNLQAVEWVRTASRTIERGFLVLVDYGHEASELFSASHADGTLATFTTHVVEVREGERRPPWLRDPGDGDITSHVNLSAVREAAEREGLHSLCSVDQMHFLLGLGVEGHLRAASGSSREDVARRLALKTLLMPGGLGTTHRVLVFGRGVGWP